MMWRRTIFLFVLLAALNGTGCQEPPPTPAPAGFTVAPAFEEWYARFGPELLGAPITGQCLPEDGTIVQYFDNARLERTANGTIQFHPLGQWALSGVRNRIAAAVPADSPLRTFPETGYAVQDQFLTFYEQNNGEQLLGPPLSEQLDEGELRVQYFLNGRLEWHPDAPPEQRVRLGQLGQAHFQQGRGNGLQCDLFAQFDASLTPTNVSLTAVLDAPILYTSGDEQVVHVTAFGPSGMRVSGIDVLVTVHYRGEAIAVDIGATGQDGVVSGSLDMIRFEPEQDVLLVITAHNNEGATLGQTTVSFKTWY